MKSFESHAAAKASVAVTADDIDFETAERGPEREAEGEHDLAAELRSVIENRETATIGAYAGIVNRLLGELTLAEQHLMTVPATLQRPGPTRAHVPMTEEQEQRIVDWFVAREAEDPWSRLR